MCDGYSGYDWLKKINGRILCRCVVHARRPMERALKENPNLAKIGILFYQNINLIEEMIKEKKLEGEEKAQFRKDHAEPLWEDFKLWAASAILDVPKDSNIYQALNYMLRNYTELTNYIDIPDMPLDNNDTERLIRDMVMGKKAYLFCRDLDACKRAAMMYSFEKVFPTKLEEDYILRNILDRRERLRSDIPQNVMYQQLSLFDDPRFSV